MVGKVIAVQKNEFDDKQEQGKKVTMFKVTMVTEKGICEVWTTEDKYKPNMDCKLVIDINSRYKPVVKLA